MKKLLFSACLFYGCSPAKLNTSVNDTSSDVQEILEPVGIIPDENCRHVTVGDTPCDFVLLDQYGEPWQLYAQRGKVIVVDISTVWCYPCQMAGYSAQPIQDSYNDVVFVTVLVDGRVSGIEPTSEEVSEWSIDHGNTTSPVLQGSKEKMLDIYGITGYSISGYPSYFYIDQNMVIYSAHTGFNEQYVKQIIEEKI